MKSVHLLAFLTISLCALAKPAWACDNRAPIRVALFDFAPFYSPDINGEPQGILIDELQRIMDELDCQWQGTFYPVPLLLEKIVNGNADLAMLIHHPMLVDRVKYSVNPISKIHLSSYQTPATPVIKRFDQLRQQRVITIRGYGYSGLFERLINPDMGIDLHMATDIEAGLQMLNSDRGGYLLSYQRPTDKVIAALKLSDIMSNRLKSWDVYFALSPKFRDTSLLEQLDQSLLAR